MIFIHCYVLFFAQQNNIMNKQFGYRSYNFNIKVEFNTRVEKRIDGDRWHTVTTNCMDYDNYYEKEEVKDKFLEIVVADAERYAKEYVNNKLDGIKPHNERLSELGFK